MFYAKSQKDCIRSREIAVNFKNVFGSAVRRRLHPNTNLRLEQLAGAINCHAETLKNAVREEHNMSSDYVAATVNFFVSQGDYSFIAEIYPAVTPLVQRRKEDEQALQLVTGLRNLLNQGVAA